VARLSTSAANDQANSGQKPAIAAATARPPSINRCLPRRGVIEGGTRKEFVDRGDGEQQQKGSYLYADDDQISGPANRTGDEIRCDPEDG
jgi:hypothetical protein